jgi:2,6-dihydroxypseudooxynicotine hydrolase
MDHTPDIRRVDLDCLRGWHVDPDRMVADGVALPDVAAAARDVSTWDQWYAFWADRGEDYARQAEHSLGEGRQILAGELFWRACMAYHYAQFFWFHDPPMREAGQHRKAELYERAAPLLEPTALRFDVSVAGVSVPAYLRVPAGLLDGGRAPCVVLLGGLESTKEESYFFENECLRRGVATCAFDGPGQGELFFSLKLQAGFERFTSAVLDALVQRPELNSLRIGVLGRSLGGNYAVRSAAMDQRLAACAAWGALVDMSCWDQLDPDTRRAFAYVAGFEPDRLAEAGRFLDEVLDLRPVLSRVRCPVYVQHGALDRVIPVSQVEALVAGLTNASQVVVDIVEDGNHCVHNRYHLARPRLVDWIVGQLGGRV